VERIRQITAEEGALSYVYQLPDSEGTAKHATVGVDAHDEDIIDAPLLQEVEDLLSLVGYRILRCEGERFDLARPRIRWARLAT
jgi:hypothetical protein